MLRIERVTLCNGAIRNQAHNAGLQEVSKSGLLDLGNTSEWVSMTLTLSSNYGGVSRIGRFHYVGFDYAVCHHPFSVVRCCDKTRTTAFDEFYSLN